MKVIEIDELKVIQLDIVQALHEFCIKNNIKYSLACGSLLGAIRHNGYIPWDDDIDIYMERKDYNKFINMFPKSYRGIYEFACLETEKHWHTPFGKLFDNRTIFIENVRNCKHVGVNIDIFPVDSVPGNVYQWCLYNRVRILLHNIGLYKGSKPRKEHSFLQNMGIILRAGIMSFMSHRFHARMLSWYAQRFNGNKSAKCLFENVQGIFQKRPFDKDDFSETVIHKFEDRELCIMKGYDHSLKCGFGDYMQLPPIEKRVSHHSFKAYWKDCNYT